MDEVNQKCLVDFKYIFNDLELAKIMKHDEHNRNIYEMSTAQQIVDAQFEISKKYFVRLFVFYILCFLVPLQVSYFFIDAQY